MFVLPPISRFPSQATQYLSVANSQAISMVETNILSHPIGLEYQLVVGEGSYVLKDDLQLANHSPHPSEAQNQNVNLLATTPQPVTAGTKISLLSFKQQSLATQNQPQDISRNGRSGLTEASEKTNIKKPTDINGGSSEHAGTSTASSSELKIFISPALGSGEGNSLLSSTGKDVTKKKKPKNNIAKSNSSFIFKGIVHGDLAKRLQERSPDGYFAFTNLNRTFQWLDLSSPQKADFLTKIIFNKGNCLCHDVNQFTKSPSHVDLIMGFSTGEIIWYEPISQKYSRLNKNGIVNQNPVSEIRWIPGSENLFLAAHTDGSLLVYDKEKEDAAFLPEENGIATSVPPENSSASSESAYADKSFRSKNQKFNPVSFWKLSNQRINAFAFSPDNRNLAVVCEGGTLRIIDYLREKILDKFASYYGGFICVCWSPDGKYVLTGGQDDLVSIWSVAESRIIARCQGHHSWVTAVSFDPWLCDDMNYRFGSVGEDCRLLLWDFSVGVLHRPKATNMRLRGSICSWNHGLYRAETNGSKNLLSPNPSAPELKEHGIEHPAEPRATTAMLPPVASKKVHDDPISWLEFTKDSIITSCQAGHLRIWSRPTNFTGNEIDKTQ